MTLGAPLLILWTAQASSAQTAPSGVKEVLAAWRNTADSFSAVKCYEMTGTRLTETDPSRKGYGGKKISWKVMRQGKLYHVKYTMDAETERQQAYDGTCWYGLTLKWPHQDGIIVKNPEKSVGANLDENLAQHAAGGFFLSLRDLIERPANFNGRSNIDLLHENEKWLSLKAHQSSIRLSVSTQCPRAAEIPKSVEFTTVEGQLLPTKVEYVHKVGTVSTVYDVLVGPYEKIDKAYYPSRVEERIHRVQGSQTPTLLLSSTYSIESKSIREQPVEKFRITYSEGTWLFDDRGKDPFLAYTKEAPPFNIAIGLGGILTVLVGILLYLKKKR